MAQRSQQVVRHQQQAVDTYIRDVAGGWAAEIAKAKELLDAGVMSSRGVREAEGKGPSPERWAGVDWARGAPSDRGEDAV